MSSLDLDRVRGALLGVAVGDALGLPCEGLTAATIARRYGGELRYRLFFGKGLISDDTEQTAMVAEAILARGDRGEDAVARAFAWKLRLWFLLLPAGIGLATARACLKLLLGFPPSRSGVRSAGNGAAMRAVPIGLARPDDAAGRSALVRAVSLTTHTDPRAIEGAALVAHAAALLARKIPPLGEGFLDEVSALARPGKDLAQALERARQLLASGASSLDAARELGTTGFVLHTVPFAFFCLLRGHESFEAAVRSAVEAGGDADTIAAIVGGLAGALHGAKGMPEPWLSGLERGGRGRKHLEALAERLAGKGEGVPRPSFVYRVLRAPFFLSVVLLEGFFRLLDAPFAIAKGEWKKPPPRAQ